MFNKLETNRSTSDFAIHQIYVQKNHLLNYRHYNYKLLVGSHLKNSTLYRDGTLVKWFKKVFENMFLQNAKKFQK